jgi:hypothetical protein
LAIIVRTGKIPVTGKLQSLLRQNRFPVFLSAYQIISERKSLNRRLLLSNGPPESAVSVANFSVFFPVSREFRPENGSHLTASSAIQSQLQRNFAALLLKYAKRAGFSWYFVYQLDQRTLPPRPLHYCCSGFSPEPLLVIPFQEPAQGECLAITNRTQRES